MMRPALFHIVRQARDYIALAAFSALFSTAFAAFCVLSAAFSIAFAAFSTTFSTTAFEAFAVSFFGVSPQAASAIRPAEAKTTAIFFILYGSHSIGTRQVFMPLRERPALVCA
jgi:hypothetical protein